MIEVEGPVTMHSSNSGARRRTKRIRVNDEGRPTGGEGYTRGGGPRPPPAKKTVKKFIEEKNVLKNFFFSSDIFKNNFSWRVGNTSGFGMQLCFCMWLDGYGGVWVQLAQGARCDIGAFYTVLPLVTVQSCTST